MLDIPTNRDSIRTNLYHSCLFMVVADSTGRCSWWAAGLPLIPFSDKSMSYHVVAFYVLVYVNINLLQCIIDILLYQNHFLSHDPYFWWMRQWFYAWWGRPTCQTIYIYAFSYLYIYIYMYIMCVWVLFDTILYIYIYTHTFFVYSRINFIICVSIDLSIDLYRFMHLSVFYCYIYIYTHVCHIHIHVQLLFSGRSSTGAWRSQPLRGACPHGWGGSAKRNRGRFVNRLAHHYV